MLLRDAAAGCSGRLQSLNDAVFAASLTPVLLLKRQQEISPFDNRGEKKERKKTAHY